MSSPGRASSGGEQRCQFDVGEQRSQFGVGDQRSQFGVGEQRSQLDVGAGHPPRGAGGRRLSLAVAICCIVLGLLGVGQVANAHTVKLDQPRRESAHVRNLARAIDRGGAARMQALFPEGEFFTVALTGLTAGRLADLGVDVESNRRVLDEAVRRLDQPAIAAPFGDHEALEHGAFFRGWRLLVLVQQARLDQSTRPRMVQEASEILQALASAPKGIVTSYPEQAWPCDLIVAGAAVAQANELVSIPGYAQAMATWLPKIEAWRDPETGLIGHQLNVASGKADGARGTSQVIINTFLPDISASLAAQEYRIFRDTFVAREFSLVGIREYPRGVHKAGDVDSGPLIAGMSMSASAVGLGAARRNGDLELARELNRESRLLGLELPAPGKNGGGLAFAFGVLPVGDAFVIAARTEPSAVSADSLQPPPSPLWPVGYAIAMLPWLLAWPLLARWRSSRQRNSATLNSARI